MKNKIRSWKLLYLLFIVVIISCNTKKSALRDTEAMDISAEIRLTLFNYYSDIKKEGLLAEFKYLDSSSSFFWVPPGYNSSITYDSVAAILKKNALFYKSIENTWDTLTIIPLSREIATYSGRIHSKMTDSAGKSSEVVLIESGTVIKRGDKWKLLCGQTSVINN